MSPRLNQIVTRTVLTPRRARMLAAALRDTIDDNLKASDSGGIIFESASYFSRLTFRRNFIKPSSSNPNRLVPNRRKLYPDVPGGMLLGHDMPSLTALMRATALTSPLTFFGRLWTSAGNFWTKSRAILTKTSNVSTLKVLNSLVTRS